DLNVSCRPAPASTTYRLGAPNINQKKPRLLDRIWRNNGDILKEALLQFISNWRIP
ncbi:hypothetical protein BGX33_010150, partial [Mortierella sp. NVP41]